jgi:WD40 repeat protein
LGAQNGVVLLARIPGGEVLQELKAHRDRVTAVAFHPEGRLLVTASRDRTVRLWQRRGDAFHELLKLDFDRPVETARFSPDGDKLAVPVHREYAVRLGHLDRLRERLVAMGLGW